MSGDKNREELSIQVSPPRRKPPPSIDPPPFLPVMLAFPPRNKADPKEDK